MNIHTQLNLSFLLKILNYFVANGDVSLQQDFLQMKFGDNVTLLKQSVS